MPLVLIYRNDITLLGHPFRTAEFNLPLDLPCQVIPSIDASYVYKAAIAINSKGDLVTALQLCLLQLLLYI